MFIKLIVLILLVLSYILLRPEDRTVIIEN